ncbi:uncharacterized protein LOC135371279 isoform X2 [Ornithodoros turicata]|uniref:uncharacterized protein LOC135371279 isoform X2 n=1 Tax=Ornithodoros turicata TaxID=34597 RepID=UPI003139BD71
MKTANMSPSVVAVIVLLVVIGLNSIHGLTPLREGNSSDMYKWRPIQVYVVGGDDHGPHHRYRSIPRLREYGQAWLNMVTLHSKNYRCSLKFNVFAARMISANETDEINQRYIHDQKLSPTMYLSAPDPNFEHADIVLIFSEPGYWDDIVNTRHHFGKAKLCTATKFILVHERPYAFAAIIPFFQELLVMMGGGLKDCIYIEENPEACCNRIRLEYKRALTGADGYKCYNTEKACCTPTVAEPNAFSVDALMSTKALTGEYQDQTWEPSNPCNTQLLRNPGEDLSLGLDLPDGVPCEPFESDPVCINSTCTAGGYYDRLYTLRTIWNLPLESSEGPQCRTYVYEEN